MLRSLSRNSKIYVKWEKRKKLNTPLRNDRHVDYAQNKTTADAGTERCTKPNTHRGLKDNNLYSLTTGMGLST